MAKIIVQNTEITVLSHNDKDYISPTDMANGKQSESRAANIIKNWIRTRYTIEFLGTWEMIHNPNFKVVEFDHFRMQADLPNFVDQRDIDQRDSSLIPLKNQSPVPLTLDYIQGRYLLS